MFRYQLEFMNLLKMESDMCGIETRTHPADRDSQLLLLLLLLRLLLQWLIWNKSRVVDVRCHVFTILSSLMTLYDTVWHTGWCLPCLDSSALWHQHSSDQTVSLLPTLSTHSYSTIIPELQKSIIWEGYHNLSVLQSSPRSAGQTFCDNKL